MTQVGQVRVQRFDSLTGMRALAALAVAIHHGSAFWPTIPVFVVIGRYGYIGVDFFSSASQASLCSGHGVAGRMHETF
jgi:peptidoglycan/LPS O-acetylase OafA/YrhL